MNLKKHICIRCWKKYYEEEDLDPLDSWTNWDEQNWGKGEIVYCPDNSYNSTSSIPKDCPYALEHLTQEDEDE